MARVTFIFSLLVVTFFASTSAVFYECTTENVMNCVKNLADLNGETNPEVVCEPLTGIKRCLTSVKSSCSDLDYHREVSSLIESNLESIQGRLNVCPNNAATGIQMFGAAMANHVETTKKPFECTYVTFNTCTGPLQNMSGESLMGMCRIWWQSQGCIMDHYNFCDESSPVKTGVEQLLGSLKQNLAFCKDRAPCTIEKKDACLNENPINPNEGGQCSQAQAAKDCLMKLTVDCVDTYVLGIIKGEALVGIQERLSRCHAGTTRDPWAEPSGDTTRDPWAEPNGDTTRDPWAEPNGDTTRDPWAEPNGDTTRDPWAEPNGDTTRDPWAEPNGEKTTADPSAEPKDGNEYHGGAECTLDAFTQCNNPVNTMVQDSGKDPEKMCRIWWHAKVCYANIYHDCKTGYGDSNPSIMTRIDSTWTYIESIMGYCERYAGCTDNGAKACGRNVHDAYRVEDKCREAGTARDCLNKVQKHCEDQFVRNQISWEYLPWVEKVLKDCMYGNMAGTGSLTGDAQGPYYSSAPSSRLAQPGTILTLLFVMLLKMVAGRLGI